MCIACRAEKRRANIRMHRKRQVPKQKRCQQCQQALKLDCFYLRPASADGLTSICKECQSTQQQQYTQRLTREEVPDKLCWGCKKVRPAAEFSSNRKNTDGLATACKECHIHSAAQAHQRKRQRQQQKQQQQQQQQQQSKASRRSEAAPP